VNLCFWNAYGLGLTAKGRGRVHHITDLEPDNFQTAGGVRAVIGGAALRLNAGSIFRLAEGDLHSHWFLPVSALCLRT
jgi:hypothetical protein